MRLLLSVVAAGVLLAGCTAAAEPAGESPSPFAGCAVSAGAAAAPSGAASAAPGGAVVPGSGANPVAAGGGASASGSAVDLPDISVDCFAGGDAVRLRELRGPAVINVWATFCTPCREELPLIQRLADETAGRLTVLGLDTGDSRSAAASFATDHGVSIPTLYDPDRQAIAALGIVNLPSTIFVDAAGRVYTHRDTMDAAGLTALVREHTGLSVTL